jgi:hypothetical protein
VRAEFTRPEAPEEVVGTATWRRASVEVTAGNEEADAAIRRVFRPAPVAIDDPALRAAGTFGPAILFPGTLQWFRAAALVRGQAEGLAVRFVPEGDGRVGWDPAGAYRTFVDSNERNERVGSRSA